MVKHILTSKSQSNQLLNDKFKVNVNIIIKLTKNKLDLTL